MTDAQDDAPPKPTKRQVRLKKPVAPVEPPAAGEIETPLSGPAQSEPVTAGAIAALVARARGASETAQLSDAALVSRAFLICVVAGGVTALLGISENSFVRTLGFLGPIVATLSYPLWGVAVGLHAKPSQRERFADNAYYLGFIFTQISLVVGFLPVALLNRSIESKDVLQFFGIALGASLIGLVARTLLTQSVNSVPENADIVEMEVETLARRVTAKSQTVLGEFEKLARSLSTSQAAMAEHFRVSVESLNRTVLEYDAVMRRDMKALELGAASMLDATESGAQTLAARTGGLAENLASATGAISGLERQLGEQVGQASQAIRQTAEALTQGIGAIQGVSSVSAHLDGLDRALGGIAERVERLGERVAESHSATTVSVRTVEETVDRAQTKARADVDALSVEMSQTVASLEATLNAFRAELDRLRV